MGRRPGITVASANAAAEAGRHRVGRSQRRQDASRADARSKDRSPRWRAARAGLRSTEHRRHRSFERRTGRKRRRGGASGGSAGAGCGSCRKRNREPELRRRRRVKWRARKQPQANVEAAAAVVRQDELNLQHTVITSPVDGTVVARDVSVGQTVAASLQTPTLFSIAQNLAKMEVDINVGEPDIGNVKPGETGLVLGSRLSESRSSTEPSRKSASIRRRSTTS